MDSSDLDECGLGTVTRTWTATDCAGNASSASQTITIEDTTAPVISGVGEAYTVECPTAPVFSTPSASDVCDSQVSLTYVDSSDLDECGLGTVTRTWTATDCAGNSSSASQTITIDDTTAPVFSGVGADYTVECSEPVVFSAPIALDDCDSKVTITYADSSDLDECGLGTVTRTWTATDCAGNSSSASQTITLEDTTAPVFVGNLPGNLNVQCDVDVPAAAVLTATDNCSEATVEFTEVITPGDCPGKYLVTRTWTATDCAGNSVSHTQKINVEDTIAPTFVGQLPPSSLTVECDNIPTPEVLTAIDNCGTATVIFFEAIIPGDCEGSYTIDRLWKATDSCKNFTIHKQIITVIDTTAPVISGVGEDFTVECPTEADFSSPMANDNCESEVSLTYVDSSDLDECGLGTVTRTWTATDCSGNSSSASQTITIEDTTAPVFVGNLPANMTVECDVVPEPTVVTATDNCGEVTVIFSEQSEAGDCVGNYTLTRTWTVTDCAGNTTSHTQIVTVEDTTAPDFVEDLPADMTRECDDVPVAEVLTALDKCSNANVTFAEARVDGNCVGNYTLVRTWTAVDECGNVRTHTQTITVQDTTPPVFTTFVPSFVGASSNGLPQDLTVECNDIPEADVLSATDNCGDATVVFAEVVNPTDCESVYTITRTWTATDECDNAISHVQIITVQDTTAPVISGVGEAYTVECPTTPVFSTPSATDVCDSQVSLTYVDSSDLDECGLGTVTRTWTATDCAGNSSSASQTITIEDTTAPVISGVGAAYTVECPTEAVFSIPSAADTCDNEVSVTYVDSSDLDECGLGTVTRTWTATDCAGNSSSASQTITIEDTTAPVISGVGAAYTVECPTEAVFSMPSAADTCDSEVSLTYVDSSDLDECGLGTVTRTWTATDCAGNSSSASQTITIEDTTAPVFSGVGEAYTVECPTAAVFSMPSAADTCDSEVSLTYVDSSDLDECGLGTVTRTWTATDCAGNSSSASQTITIEDTTAPVISGVGAAYTVECPTAAVFSTPSASDACDSQVSLTYVDSSDLDECGLGTVTRTWTATDCAGNSSSASQTITIEDTTAPVISGVGAAYTVECPTEAVFSMPSAADTCDSEVSLTYVDSSDLDECGLGTVTRTWTATDCAGNSSSASQTITIEDTTAPVFSGVGADYTVECSEPIVFSAPIALDDCDSKVTITYADSSDLDECGLGTKTRTWTATDCAGNSSSASQTITIEDTTAPVFVGDLPGNVNVQCDVPEAAVITATDNCSEVEVEFSEVVTPGDCPGKYLVTRTWTATDCAGNSVSHTQKINVEDTIAPTFVGQLPPNSLTVECDNIPTPEVLTAIDNCGTATVIFYEAIIPGDCPGSYIIDRIWKATDSCKNFTIHKQMITVQDTTAPVVTPAANQSVNCDGNGNLDELALWLASNGGASATDSCSDVTWSDSFDGFDGTCGAVTVTFTATDCSGNASSTTATFTINTVGINVSVPANVSPDCDADLDVAFAQWIASFSYDGGCGELTATDLTGFVLPEPGQTITVTFVVTDECGSTETRVVTFTTPECFDGCTIGYWKNHTDRWCATYSTTTLYGSVFVNAPNGLANKTLLQVVNLGGGGVNNLGRQSVAALLNACHADINYPTPYSTVQSIINAVNAAFIAGGNAPGQLASQLDQLNNTGCPLGGSPATKAKVAAVASFEAYPVPFVDELTIRYEFDYKSDVTIEFFDIRGSLIRTFKDDSSYYKKEVKLDVSFLNESGQVYFIKITTDQASEIKKVISGLR
uniref:HYR-like domain-containing protein n=1 Tax=Flavobacterium orientale TaxID=1756020 RepID=UPI001E406001|nr:T9SS type A sorting domain-containing protein [Flavobacterium orientale]